MTYELAKQLKDAGFPFIKCEHDESSIKIPTLSELIEACGAGFDHLMRVDEGFLAFPNDIDVKNDGEDYLGKTPEEAVAKLWLKLNT
jgi:hypothetical protein